MIHEEGTCWRCGEPATFMTTVTTWSQEDLKLKQVLSQTGYEFCDAHAEEANRSAGDALRAFAVRRNA